LEAPPADHDIDGATLGGQIYWTSYYNLQRAQDEVRKELRQLALEVNAAAEKQGVNGIPQAIIESLDYDNHLADDMKKWETESELKNISKAVKKRAVYAQPKSLGTDRGVF
jgi:hypothetical protein